MLGMACGWLDVNAEVYWEYMHGLAFLYININFCSFSTLNILKSKATVRKPIIIVRGFPLNFLYKKLGERLNRTTKCLTFDLKTTPYFPGCQELCTSVSETM